MSKELYFDYAASTPIDPRVLDAMLPYMSLEGSLGNPSSTNHYYGQKARLAIEIAREQVATTVNCNPEELIWTSGATESINMAILGAARFYQYKGRHIITMATEHNAALDTCKELKREGFELTILDPEPNGLLDLNKLKAAIKPDTILASIMHVNNETGIIQDIKSIGACLHEHGVLYHCDGAQAMGKVMIDLHNTPVDYYSINAQKVYGPKGIGALYISQKTRAQIKPITFGGSQEKGLRPGTQPTHQIIGMAEAFKIAHTNFDSDQKHSQDLYNQLRQGLSTIPEIKINGIDLISQTKQQIGQAQPTENINTQSLTTNKSQNSKNIKINAHTDKTNSIESEDKSQSYTILNISFNYIDANALMESMNCIAISTGSACSTESLNPSHVLTAMGLDAVMARSTIRISFGRFTTADEIDQLIELLQTHVAKLRELSPLWQQRETL